MLTPHLSLAWQHDAGNAPVSSHTLATGQSFAVTGNTLAGDTALLDLGANMTFANATAVGLSYTGMLSSAGSVHQITANLEQKF